jgi:hypothetical protein
MVWKKPVICIFKERDVKPEIEPFVVVKAAKLTLSKQKDDTYIGKMQDFFTLMGDADYLRSPEGKADHYVMCWFDDTEPDMTKDLRRLQGVTLKGEVTCVLNQAKKRTYNGAIAAKHGKIK